MKKQDKLTVTADDLTHEGMGVAHVEGMAVFVKGLLPEETAEIDIIKVAKNYAVGRIMELLKPSPQRTEACCPAFGRCGGCTLMHLSYPAQLQMKAKRVVDCLTRIGGVEADIFEGIVGMENPYGYRNKAPYPAAMIEGEVRLGFYAARSHRLVPVERCPVQMPVVQQAYQVVCECLRKYPVAAYDEAAGEGLLRHVMIRASQSTGEVMIVYIIRGRALPGEKGIAEFLKERVKGLAGVLVNQNIRSGNVILGDGWRTLWGRDHIEDELCGLKLRVSPASFFQVNPVQAQRLYEKAVEYGELTKEDTIFDGYCGTGTLTLVLARQAKRAVGVEVVPEAVADARINAANNGLADQTEFWLGKAEEVLPAKVAEGFKPDVVVFDPPRKGCHPDFLAAMAKAEPKRMVYVSCDPATLARDIALLRELGYAARRAKAFDLFPHSGHVECVVQLSADG